MQNMARLLRPGGTILLIEHGKASWSFVNEILDAQADTHSQKWGCEWNRDIIDIVQKAGLRVQSCSRWHFGTTYIVVATTNADTQHAMK